MNKYAFTTSVHRIQQAQSRVRSRVKVDADISASEISGSPNVSYGEESAVELPRSHLLRASPQRPPGKGLMQGNSNHIAQNKNGSGVPLLNLGKSSDGAIGKQSQQLFNLQNKNKPIKTPRSDRSTKSGRKQYQAQFDNSRERMSRRGPI